MARKTKKQIEAEAAEAAAQAEAAVDAFLDSIAETTSLIHDLFESLEANNPIIRAALRGAIIGYLDLLIEQEMVALHHVVCDETNNFDEDVVPFVEINIGFDMDNLDNYIAFAIGSEEAIEEWNEANTEEAGEESVG